MRGFFILSILLGLLYYSFLNKESAHSEIKFYKSMKTRAAEIADHESYRAEAAMDCNDGDDEEASDCLASTYRKSRKDPDQDLDSTSRPRKNSGSLRRPLSGKLGKFSGGTDIQGL